MISPHTLRQSDLWWVRALRWLFTALGQGWVVLIFFLLLVGSFCANWPENSFIQTNPKEHFKYTFQIEPPPDVSEIKAGAEVLRDLSLFLKFKASERFFRELERTSKLVRTSCDELDFSMPPMRLERFPEWQPEKATRRICLVDEALDKTTRLLFDEDTFEIYVALQTF
jgi:hypothetical protein